VNDKIPGHSIPFCFHAFPRVRSTLDKNSLYIFFHFPFYVVVQVSPNDPCSFAKAGKSVLLTPTLAGLLNRGLQLKDNSGALLLQNCFVIGSLFVFRVMHIKFNISNIQLLS
jgi:hypothetical protein